MKKFIQYTYLALLSIIGIGFSIHINAQEVLGDRSLEQTIRTGEVVSDATTPGFRAFWQIDAEKYYLEASPPFTSSWLSDSLVPTSFINFNHSGPGSFRGQMNSLNLRGMHSRRNSILFGGLPVIPSTLASQHASEQVNFDVVPMFAVQNVDIDRGGPSGSRMSSQGTGVVNVVPNLKHVGVNFKVTNYFADTATDDLLEQLDGSASNALSTLAGWDFGQNHLVIGVEVGQTSHVTADSRDWISNDFTANYAGAWHSNGQSGKIGGDAITFLDPDCEEIGGVVIANTSCASNVSHNDNLVSSKDFKKYVAFFTQEYESGAELTLQYVKNSLDYDHSNTWLVSGHSALNEVALSNAHPGLVGFMQGIAEGYYQDDNLCAIRIIPTDSATDASSYTIDALPDETSALYSLGTYANQECMVNNITTGYTVDNNEVVLYDLLLNGTKLSNATEFDNNWNYTGGIDQLSFGPTSKLGEFDDQRFSFELIKPISEYINQKFAYVSQRQVGINTNRDLLSVAPIYGIQGIAGSGCDTATDSPGNDPCVWLNPFSNVRGSYYNAQINNASNSTTAPVTTVFSWAAPEFFSRDETELRAYHYELNGKFKSLFQGSWGGQFHYERTKRNENYQGLYDRSLYPCMDPNVNNVSKITITDDTTNETSVRDVTLADCQAVFANDTGRGVFSTITAGHDRRIIRHLFDSSFQWNVLFGKKSTLNANVRYAQDSETDSYLLPSFSYSGQLFESLKIKAGISTSLTLPTLVDLTNNTFSESKYFGSLGTHLAVDIASNSSLEAETSNVNFFNVEWTNNLFSVFMNLQTISVDSPILVENPYEVLNSVCPFTDGIRMCDQSHLNYDKLTVIEPEQDRIIDGKWQLDAYSIDRIRSAKYNGNSIESSSLDFGFDYIIVGGAPIKLSFTHSELTSYKIDGSNKLGRLNANDYNVGSLPKSRSNVTIDWQYNRSKVLLRYNVVSDYEDNRDLFSIEPSSSQVTLIDQRTVDSYSTIDLHYNYNWLKPNIKLVASISNLSDASPPFAQLPNSYDPAQHSPYGRVFSLSGSFNIE